MIRPSGQSISDHIGAAWLILDVQIKGCNVLFPPGLPGSESFLGVKELEGGMVGDQSTVAPFKVDTPDFESMMDLSCVQSLG